MFASMKLVFFQFQDGPAGILVVLVAKQPEELDIHGDNVDCSARTWPIVMVLGMVEARFHVLDIVIAYMDSAILCGIDIVTTTKVGSGGD